MFDVQMLMMPMLILLMMLILTFSDYNFAENSNNLLSPDFQDSFKDRM